MVRVLLSSIIYFLVTSSFVAQSYTSYFIGNEIDRTVEDLAFALTAMGGEAEVDYAMRLFLEDARGGDVLVLRTSGTDGYNDYFYSELGVEVNSVETIVCHSKDASFDPYVLDRILKAEAVWFADGDQWEYLSYWRGTALQQYLNFAILDKGMPVGGIGSGLAIMEQYQFTGENGTVTSEEALSDPYNDAMTIDNRAFLILPLPIPIIFDSHFDDLNRRGRMVAFLARIKKDFGKTAFGLGLDGETAARIKEGDLLIIDDEFIEDGNGVHMLIVDCEINPLEFIVESGEPLTWTENQIRHVKIGSGPTDSIGLDILTGFQNFSPYEDNFVNISEGEYEEEMNDIDEGYSFSCWIVSGTEDENTTELSISPNPVINTLTIDRFDLEIINLEIISIGGQVVMTLDAALDVADLSGLPTGIYLLKIKTRNKQIVRKFVKI